MAGIALRRHRLEAAIGSAFVTGVAVDGRMSSGQRKTIRMLLDLLDGNLPSADRVALLAIGAQLALVNVGVAILTALAHAGENHLDVTLCAGYRGVHTAQGIPRLVMVELGNRADRPPAVCGVAVLAGDG